MKLFATLALLATTSVFAGPWKYYSDPDNMSPDFEHTFSKLPLEGNIPVDTKGWSGHFWPSKEGGINVRWNSPDKVGFKYPSPSKSEVAKMSIEELAQLAPTEKYDLYLGRYDYPLKSNAANFASKRAEDWAGICHGWSPASLHHTEPTPKTVTNPDGLKIPFGSADIKALLSYYYAFEYSEDTSNQMGLRCKRFGIRGCGDDLNAGAFHIVIANKLGLQGKGFLMDKERGREVWNQPVTGYTSTFTWNSPRLVEVSTKLYFTDESDPVWETVFGTANQKREAMSLEYTLELDASGRIVGGSWESYERPDFLWNRGKTPGFSGLLGQLGNLLND